MKKVIVTGAGGFIGLHCLPYLVAKGFEVHAISTRQVDLDSPGVIWHCVDLLDSEKIQQLFLKIRPTHLLHFAWITDPGNYWNSMENFHWLKASVTIMQKFAEAGGERILMAGTCAEYDWRYGFCSEELTPLNPQSVYGCCKNSMQQLLSSFCENNGLSWAWGRIFFLYGPRENPFRLVPEVINALLKNKVARCSRGDQLRDYLYVKDVASAFVALLDSQFNGPANIASGNAVTIRQIVNTVAEKIDRSDLIQFGALPDKPDDPSVLIADVRQLVESIGWKPEYDMDKGLDETITYWQDAFK